jgi:hypothetical protein
LKEVEGRLESLEGIGELGRNIEGCHREIGELGREIEGYCSHIQPPLKS